VVGGVRLANCMFLIMGGQEKLAPEVLDKNQRLKPPPYDFQIPLRDIAPNSLRDPEIMATEKKAVGGG